MKNGLRIIILLSLLALCGCGGGRPQTGLLGQAKPVYQGDNRQPYDDNADMPPAPPDDPSWGRR